MGFSTNQSTKIVIPARTRNPNSNVQNMDNKQQQQPASLPRHPRWRGLAYVAGGGIDGDPGCTWSPMIAVNSTIQTLHCFPITSREDSCRSPTARKFNKGIVTLHHGVSFGEGPDNYKMWSSTIRSVLEREDLWDVVVLSKTTQKDQNKEASPLVSGTSSSLVLMEREEMGSADQADDSASKTSLTKQEQEILRRQRTRAVGFLRLSLLEMIKSYILDTSDSTVAWKILANIYSTKTIADVIRILDKWKNLKMTENMIMSIFIQHVYNLLNDLKEINELPMDIVIVHKILKNLP
uniref:Uncharacterized protein n=1 Tax=Physcomitrium patens TaxID=3218 RepID=A0A2K1KI59_PHYPA|nr:hypothetical protein PHYPA_007118 [Physcomitrium patens]